MRMTVLLISATPAPGRKYAFDMMPESGHTGHPRVAVHDDLDLRLL